MIKRKRKRKRRRKNKLPKNFDPNVLPNPDRWKPKHLRAGYRGKKPKPKQNTRGIQGSAVVSQAQQLADSGIKGAVPLKNNLSSQIQNQIPINKKEEVQQKAKMAAQAASKGKGKGKGKK